MTQHDVWSWCKFRFFLIKKIKIGCPEYSQPPPPSLHLITSHFCLTPTPIPHPLTPPQSGRRMCITPKTTTAGWMYPGVPSHAKTCLDLPDMTLVCCMSTLEVIQKERLISKINLKKCFLSCITYTFT